MVVASGLVAWQKTTQVQALQIELAALRGERQGMEAQMLSLQNTASALESRLATLEANDPAQQLSALQAAVETADDPQELDSLRASLAEIQTKVDVFQGTLDEVAARIESLESANTAAGGTLPPEARLDVPRQRQSHNLSCESCAASMAAQYQGVNLSEAEILAALPRNDNPHLGFRGNVDGPTGGIEDYGVYAGPVLAILNSRGLRARAVEGGLEGIKAAIARGNPVIAWVTYNCRTSTPVEATIGGKTVALVPWQHVVVVTGYNADGVWANDPWDGQEDFYTSSDLQRAMSYFDNMAIEVAAPQ
jgi:uncharacterized protein YvpB/prefoldin subunit 5